MAKRSKKKKKKPKVFYGSNRQFDDDIKSDKLQRFINTYDDYVMSTESKSAKRKKTTDSSSPRNTLNEALMTFRSGNKVKSEPNLAQLDTNYHQNESSTLSALNSPHKSFLPSEFRTLEQWKTNRSNYFCNTPTNSSFTQRKRSHSAMALMDFEKLISDDTAAGKI